MFIAILGRQPDISVAELMAVFGEANVSRVAHGAASIQTDHFDINQLGGSLKCGEIIGRLPAEKTDKSSLLAASKFITKTYQNKFKNSDKKITFGISVYGLKSAPRDVQKIGLILKNSLKKAGVNLRLVPNSTAELSTATSHNNKLGLSATKIEILVVRTRQGELLIAESRGAQNITAYTKRDRYRPRRDAFVGMLPPKLAQIMINLACGQTVATAANTSNAANRILDPFCGTGTVLQEALLKGFTVYGSDLNQKMIDYTTENLKWLNDTRKHTGKIADIRAGDAMTFKWPEAPELTAVVCETYLGQPFSAPPKPEKLREVVGNCNHIITEFLTNLHPQINSKTTLCLAVPAWRGIDDKFTHLPLIQQLEKLGYRRLNWQQLLYHRPEQVVAREILLLLKL